MKNKILLLSFSVLSVLSCKKKDEKPPQGPKVVSTVAVENRNVTGYSEFPASIEGRVNNDVRAKMSGYITQVLVDEGQFVTKGQPLFRLETNSLNQSANAAKAGVGSARSMVAASDANIQAAQSAVKAAQVEVNKLRPLVEKNIISSVQLQTAQANLARAQAQVSQAIAGKAQGPKVVSTVAVEYRNVTGYSEFPASIEGRVNNDVRAKMSGYITQVLVDEGQYVTKGQPLFRLETNSLNQSANAAKAGVGSARSMVAASEANIQAAQSAVKAAQVEVNKLRPLVEKNIISSVQLQTAQANLARAQAQVSQAIAGKAQANAGVAEAKANFQGVQANIDYSVIRAPISGVIGKINFRNGSLVGPGDPMPISTVSDTSELYVYFSMNEKEYLDFLKNAEGATVPDKLKNMPPVELLLANGDVYEEKGYVKAVTGQIDANTGSIQFRVSFPNPKKLLSNGNSGTIKIPVQYDNVLVVPESATYEQQGLVYIYKVKQDTAKTAVVNIIDRVNNMVLIKDGAAKGDIVVAEGVGTLKSGTAVKPQPKKFDDLINAIKPIF